MSWATENAFKRVFNVFKRSKDKIYKEDIEALKLLNEELLNSQKKYVNDNILYAKLLCFVMYKNIEHFKDIKKCIQHIQENVFNGSLQEHIEILKLNLNKNDFDEYLNTLGLSESIEFTDSEKESDLVILTKKQNEVINKLKKFWSHEKVKKSFYNTANEFLKDVDNYK